MRFTDSGFLTTWSFLVTKSILLGLSITSRLPAAVFVTLRDRDTAFVFLLPVRYLQISSNFNNNVIITSCYTGKTDFRLITYFEVLRGFYVAATWAQFTSYAGKKYILSVCGFSAKRRPPLTGGHRHVGSNELEIWEKNL